MWSGRIKATKMRWQKLQFQGANNFKLSPFLFAMSNPKTGPKIIADKPKDICRNPTFSGSSPNPDGAGANPSTEVYL